MCRPLQHNQSSSKKDRNNQSVQFSAFQELVGHENMSFEPVSYISERESNYRSNYFCMK